MRAADGKIGLRDLHALATGLGEHETIACLRACVGSIGFANKMRPREHPASGAPEMGWSLGAAAHGKGYATEGVAAALAWGREFFGAGARTVCVISTGNDASFRVAEKSGFRQFATATRYGLGRLAFEREL